MTSSKKQRGKGRCWLTGGGRNNARKSDLALIFLHQCRKQTNQTALASGQSRATPVRSCKEDGGFKLCFSCCSWLSSFSKRRSPGSSSCSLCSAETYRKHGQLVYLWVSLLLFLLFMRTPERDLQGFASQWRLVVFRLWDFSGLKRCYVTCTCLGQQEELPALSSAAVCGEAEILNASNHADLTTYSI